MHHGLGTPYQRLTNFRLFYSVTQIFGIAFIILILLWSDIHSDGYAWTKQARLPFNWHPLLMSIGMIFLYGNSILIYRGFRYARKKTLKLIHAAIHAVALVCVVVGLVVAFDSHNMNVPFIPKMNSLHSWIGMGAVVMFAGQYVCGFVFYMYPGISHNVKEAYMPIHVFFGLFGFILAIAAALLGLFEMAFFSIPDYSQLPPSGILMNTIGLCLVLFGAMVVYLTTDRSYQRQPMIEEIQYVAI